MQIKIDKMGINDKKTNGKSLKFKKGKKKRVKK